MSLAHRIDGLWRLVRFGPGLYRSVRNLGGSRLRALAIVLWP